MRARVRIHLRVWYVYKTTIYMYLTLNVCWPCDREPVNCISIYIRNIFAKLDAVPIHACAHTFFFYLVLFYCCLVFRWTHQQNHRTQRKRRRRRAIYRKNRRNQNKNRARSDAERGELRVNSLCGVRGAQRRINAAQL